MTTEERRDGEAEGFSKRRPSETRNAPFSIGARFSGLDNVIFPVIERNPLAVVAHFELNGPQFRLGDDSDPVGMRRIGSQSLSVRARSRKEW